MRTSEASTNVTTQQIENLPQDDRNFLNFATLAPGIRLSTDPQRKVISSDAQPAEQTNVFIDGVSFKNDVLQGGLVGQDSSRGNPFPQNAVQEFRVVTQNYSAQYDKAASAIITAVTKSGGNAIARPGVLVLPAEAVGLAAAQGLPVLDADHQHESTSATSPASRSAGRSSRTSSITSSPTRGTTRRPRRRSPSATAFLEPVRPVHRQLPQPVQGEPGVRQAELAAGGEPARRLQRQLPPRARDARLRRHDLVPVGDRPQERGLRLDAARQLEQRQGPQPGDAQLAGLLLEPDAAQSRPRGAQLRRGHPHSAATAPPRSSTRSGSSCATTTASPSPRRGAATTTSRSASTSTTCATTSTRA